MDYDVRFWNKAGENIRVCGKYRHTFDTLEDAYDSANALCASAYELGAVEVDINNEFYKILTE